MSTSDPLLYAKDLNYEVLYGPGNPSPATTLPDTPSSPLPTPRRTKSKIRENPVLERFVSDMLLRGYSFRDTEKSVRESLHITVSRETIRQFYEVVLLPRLELSPRSKAETWRALLDLDETMETSITKSEADMLKFQIRAVSVLEERLLRLHEETKAGVNSRQLNALSRTTRTILKAQRFLFDQYQKALGSKKRMELYRQKVLEALQAPLGRFSLQPPHTTTDIIKLVDFVMRSLDP
jgi:hypothetical protein